MPVLLQVSDWSQRPLSDRQLQYAALDAAVQLPVYDAMTTALAGKRGDSVLKLHQDWRAGMRGRLRAQREYADTLQATSPVAPNGTDGSLPSAARGSNALVQESGKQAASQPATGALLRGNSCKNLSAFISDAVHDSAPPGVQAAHRSAQCRAHVAGNAGATQLGCSRQPFCLTPVRRLCGCSAKGMPPQWHRSIATSGCPAHAYKLRGPGRNVSAQAGLQGCRMRGLQVGQLGSRPFLWARMYGSVRVAARLAVGMAGRGRMPRVALL